MKYIANPVEVEAYTIADVGQAASDGSRVLVLDGAKNPVTATAEMMSRMGPKIGDYWVIQSDGYIYLNPKDVFERKYRKV